MRRKWCEHLRSTRNVVDKFTQQLFKDQFEAAKEFKATPAVLFGSLKITLAHLAH